MNGVRSPAVDYCMIYDMILKITMKRKHSLGEKSHRYHSVTGLPMMNRVHIGLLAFQFSHPVYSHDFHRGYLSHLMDAESLSVFKSYVNRIFLGILPSLVVIRECNIGKKITLCWHVNCKYWVGFQYACWYRNYRTETGTGLFFLQLSRSLCSRRQRSCLTEYLQKRLI